MTFKVIIVFIFSTFYIQIRSNVKDTLQSGKDNAKVKFAIDAQLMNCNYLNSKSIKYSVPNFYEVSTNGSAGVWTGIGIGVEYKKWNVRLNQAFSSSTISQDFSFNDPNHVVETFNVKHSHKSFVSSLLFGKIVHLKKSNIKIETGIGVALWNTLPDVKDGPIHNASGNQYGLTNYKFTIFRNNRPYSFVNHYGLLYTQISKAFDFGELGVNFCYSQTYLKNIIDFYTTNGYAFTIDNFPNKYNLLSIGVVYKYYLR